MNFRTKDTFRIYWKHARTYPGTMLIMSLALIGAVIAEAFSPYFYKLLFDLLANNASLPELMGVVFSILIAATIGWAFWRVATFTNNRFEPKVMRDLVNTCFAYLNDHSYNFFSNNFAGSLVKKIGRYERSFEDIADQIYWSLAITIFKVAVIIGVLYFVKPILATAVLIWSLFYVAFSIAYSIYKLKFDVQNAALDTVVGGRLVDTIGSNINLKLYGSTERELKSLKQLTEKQFLLRRWTWDLSSFSELVQSGMFVILEFVVMYMAVRLWKQGAITIGVFAMLQGYMVQIFARLWDLGRQIKNIYVRLGDAEEMTEILLTPHEVQDRPGAGKLKVSAGLISFREVAFGYSKRNIFQNFNLAIQPGERVAFVGPSGGGKTTIIKLLFRFLDLQSGAILIDGQDIADVTQDSLRATLSLVPQDPILFHRSLYDNIAYARPNASEKEVYDAAKSAHAHEFITSFPKGYDTFVGERGVKLSGGERQRVAIARAILKNAPILVLDEATSSLDSESEMLIQDALKNLMKGKTTIVIAHRLSTIMQMDRIVVIKKGKVVEEGKHQELLKARQGVYQKLWEIQAGGFNG